MTLAPDTTFWERLQKAGLQALVTSCELCSRAELGVKEMQIKVYDTKNENAWVHTAPTWKRDDKDETIHHQKAKKWDLINGLKHDTEFLLKLTERESVRITNDSFLCLETAFDLNPKLKMVGKTYAATFGCVMDHIVAGAVDTEGKHPRLCSLALRTSTGQGWNTRVISVWLGESKQASESALVQLDSQMKVFANEKGFRWFSWGGDETTDLPTAEVVDLQKQYADVVGPQNCLTALPAAYTIAKQGSDGYKKNDKAREFWKHWPQPWLQDAIEKVFLHKPPQDEDYMEYLKGVGDGYPISVCEADVSAILVVTEYVAAMRVNQFGCKRWR